MTTELNQDLNIEVAEIDQIKQRLDLMGITYHHKANVETLRKLLASSLNPVEQVSVHDIMQEATKLIRCKITCMNPGKREWQGEIFTAGNSVIGVVRKFVPYNCEAAESYHIPAIIVNAMKDRKFLQVRSVKTKSGASQESYLAQEFVIVELPPLTPEELKQLSDEQKAGRGL